jgi:hypothetical protein
MAPQAKLLIHPAITRDSCDYSSKTPKATVTHEVGPPNGSLVESVGYR